MSLASVGVPERLRVANHDAHVAGRNSTVTFEVYPGAASPLGGPETLLQFEGNTGVLCKVQQFAYAAEAAYYYQLSSCTMKVTIALAAIPTSGFVCMARSY